MKKAFVFLVSISLLLFNINNAFSSNWQYHWIKNTAWEGYGKLDSSYNYGRHRFEFDNSDKLVHYIDRQYEDVYTWTSDYKGNVKVVKASNYSMSSGVAFEIIDRYSIKIDGLTLKRVYH